MKGRGLAQYGRAGQSRLVLIGWSSTRTQAKTTPVARTASFVPVPHSSFRK